MSDKIYKWRPEEEHLLKLLLPTNTSREISEQINRRADQKLPGFPCKRSEDAVRRKILRDNLHAANVENYTAKENPALARLEKLKQLQEQFRSAYNEVTVGIVAEDAKRKKILSISDIHFPLARVDLLEQILEKHRDADICVVNGDMLEQMAASTYDKDKRISLLIEYRIALEFINRLRVIFDTVVIVGGNHDVRSSRAVGRLGMPAEVSQVLRPDLLARLANGEVLDDTGMLVEKLDFGNVHYQQNESWYVKIGKTIFAHPHGRGSKKPGWTVQRVQEYFSTRYEAGEVDCIVIGHTHKVYWGVHNRQLLIEQGCLAGLLAYAHKPKLEFIGNGVNAYAVIYQDEEGNCDWNMSGPVYLGEVIPPKKEIL